MINIFISKPPQLPIEGAFSTKTENDNTKYAISYA